MDEPAVQAVEYCDKLFDYERISKEKQHTFDEHRDYRIKNEKPVIEAFWNWIDRQHPVKKSRLDKAINYALNRRDLLETYLEDDRCSLSYNLSENAIRSFTVGKKTGCS